MSCFWQNSGEIGVMKFTVYLNIDLLWRTNSCVSEGWQRPKRCSVALVWRPVGWRPRKNQGFTMSLKAEIECPSLTAVSQQDFLATAEWLHFLVFRHSADWVSLFVSRKGNMFHLAYWIRGPQRNSQMIFKQLSRQPLVQSTWHIWLTITGYRRTLGPVWYSRYKKCMSVSWSGLPKHANHVFIMKISVENISGTVAQVNLALHKHIMERFRKRRVMIRNKYKKYHIRRMGYDASRGIFTSSKECEQENVMV